MAQLLLDVLAENRKKRFLLHEFVIMPNHFQLLLTPAAGVPLEKALQLIKGGFSFRRPATRASKALNLVPECSRGFKNPLPRTESPGLAQLSWPLRMLSFDYECLHSIAVCLAVRYTSVSPSIARRRNLETSALSRRPRESLSCDKRRMKMLFGGRW
jgi:hypothetical protein